jgi:tRNA nucleotidyltransferase (CCA-adding enzyme)
MQPRTLSLSRKDFFADMPTETVEAVDRVVHFLREHYYVRPYIVGGAVRDSLLGRSSSDIDIECYGITPERFEEAMGELGAEGVGKSFFVYKYGPLDIALPRTEKKVGVGHRGFSVALAREEREASRRRDFTVNALMYDPRRELILDYWGGLEDPKRKILRVVDPVSFVEDSLRGLRAMQFAARFGVRVEEESCRLCRGIELEDLPKERLFLEFDKMFRGDYPHYGLYYLFTLGIAEKILGLRPLEHREFILLARELLRGREYFLVPLYPYYFPYILASFLGVDRHYFLERIGAPGTYLKKVADSPLLPATVDCAFVARTARKEGIEHYVGNYRPEVANLAKQLGVWKQPFAIDVKPVELMAQGYEGRALGEELERRREEKIRRLDEDCG